MDVNFERLLLSNAECLFTEVCETISEAMFHEALRVREYGMEKISAKVEKRLRRNSFEHETEYFMEQAQGNLVGFHLMMAVYFARVFDCCFSRDEKKQKSQIIFNEAYSRNRSWVGTLVLHHLVLLMARVGRKSILSLQTVDPRLGIDPFEWTTTCAGALAAMRAAWLFAINDFRVFLPTPEQDFHNKIDLIAVSKQTQMTICLQVKSLSSSPSVRFLHLRQRDHFRFSNYQKEFFSGVAEAGTNWIPVECDVSRADYQRGSRSPRNTVDAKIFVESFVRSLTE